MHDATTLRSDENAWKLECSNIFSSGPQPLTVLRDIQVCCWIISKLVCLIFSSGCQCFQHILHTRFGTNKACVQSIYMCCCRCSLQVQEITPTETPNSNNACFHQGHVQFKIHGTIWHAPVEKRKKREEGRQAQRYWRVMWKITRSCLAALCCNAWPPDIWEEACLTPHIVTKHILTDHHHNSH